MNIGPSPCLGPSAETDHQLLGLCQEGQGDVEHRPWPPGLKGLDTLTAVPVQQTPPYSSNQLLWALHHDARDPSGNQRKTQVSPLRKPGETDSNKGHLLRGRGEQSCGTHPGSGCVLKCVWTHSQVCSQICPGGSCSQEPTVPQGLLRRK